MKKFLAILVLGLILFSEPANTARKSFVEGQFYEGEVNWGRGTSIILPPGKFQLIDRFDWASWGITQKGVWFVEKINGNIVHQEVSIYNVGSSKYQAYLRQWYYEYLFKDKYDGCYPRNEYTLVEVKKKLSKSVLNEKVSSDLGSGFNFIYRNCKRQNNSIYKRTNL